MNENISQLVQEHTNPTPPITEDQLNLPEDSTDENNEEQNQFAGEAIEEVPQEEPEPQVETIETTNLAQWFSQNSINFNNLSRVAVQIRGVDPDETLIIAVRDPSGAKAEDGHEKRILRLFYNADVQPVLNIPAVYADVYNIGFQIIHPYDNIVIKTYGLRTSLIATFCHRSAFQNVERFIPYAISRIKKKDEGIEVIRTEDPQLNMKMAAPLDKEAAQLLYKQVTKKVNDINTNIEFIDWLLARQAKITDINHHLQIDNVIMSILS